jgi:integrase
LVLEQLEQVVQYLRRKDDLASLRNNALGQLGFFGSFRHSELVGIQMEHITFDPEGMEILLPRSKTDPTGEGQVCAIPYGKDSLCAVHALKSWLGKAAIHSDAIFRSINRHGQVGIEALSADSVNRIIKQLAEDCRLSHAESYKGHSMRRGFVTSAIKKMSPSPY